MTNRHDTDAAAALVRKLWQYCNVLRDDGLSYPDYVEQLTYLLFLKMSDERKDGPVPRSYSWRSLVELDAPEMHRQYARILVALGKRDGMLGLIFRNAKNKIRDPGKLRLLVVGLIGQTKWTGLSTDVKGDAYEGLLEKNARDTKSGAGQYFTPRPLIQAVVSCVDPQPGEVICDPACGTGGFLLGAFEHVIRQSPQMKPSLKRHLSTKAIRGVELVEEVARLAAMNLLLHGIGGESNADLPIASADSLAEEPKTTVDVVLTNPPFGVKGSVTYASANASKAAEEQLRVVRPDFWVQTANKQLNFLQHVAALLKPGGRAAVVIPDNVLFETGAAAAVRRRLLASFDVHTLLRLPTGLFYAQGVKANVLFFDRPVGKVDESVERLLWVYDLRLDRRYSLKTNPIQRTDLDEFVKLYRPGQRHRRQQSDGVQSHARWRHFSVRDLLEVDAAPLDLAWRAELQPRSTTRLQRIDELSGLIRHDLQRALEQLAIVGVGSGKKGDGPS